MQRPLLLLLGASVWSCTTPGAHTGATDPGPPTLTPPGSAGGAFQEGPTGALVARGAGWTATLAEGRLQVDRGPDALVLATASVDGTVLPAASAQRTACAPLTTPCTAGVAIAREGLTEWWVSGPRGLQQGWTVSTPSDGPLTRIELALPGGAVQAIDNDARGATLTGSVGGTWRYTGLTAWDADGQDLAAWLETSHSGLAVVVDTAAARWPVTIDPTLSAETRITASDPERSAYFGGAIDGAGDVDGDGYADLVVGAWGHDRFFVYYGGASGIQAASEQALVPADAESEDYIGDAVAGVGDLDGDGYDDVMVGAPLDDDTAPNAGAAYLFFGSATGLDASSETKLVASDGVASDVFGTSLSGRGDLDGDGYPDVVVGASEAGSGAVYVFYGSASGLLASSEQRVESSVPTSDAAFGEVLDIRGDLNGDGFHELVVGARQDDSQNNNEGSAFLYYGTATGVDILNEEHLSPQTSGGQERFGQSVSISGDLDGDGYDELVVGSPQDDVESVNGGAAYVYWGSATGAQLASPTVLRPSDGTHSDRFGSEVRIVGDVDQDGFDDLLVGADGIDGESTSEGGVYLYRGSTTGLLELSAERYTADDPYSYSDLGDFGTIAVLGDTDGDGTDDIALGTRGDSSTESDAGAVLLYTGSCAADDDGDGVCSGLDCDDTDPTVYPGAPDTPADGIDSDCDGVEICLIDEDGDGYTVDDRTTVSADGDCGDAGEAVATAPDGDCDDADATAYPGATDTIADGVDSDCDRVELCYADTDDDGYTDGSTTVVSTDADCADLGEALASEPAGDCNDADATVFPGAPETVDDGVDSDCDALEQCYADLDGDGYTDQSRVRSADLDCTDPGEAGAGAPLGDCDDADATRFPGATEQVGDGLDSDCDGVEVCFVDADGDGVRTDETVLSDDLDCWDEGEGAASDPAGDCDDTDAGIHPGATEQVGDGLDSDCDGTELCLTDTDGDGHPTAEVLGSADADCEDPGEGAATGSALDCDDDNSDVYPEAPDTDADGIDSDCDGRELCLADADHDGYTDGSTTIDSGDGDCSDPGEALSSHPAGDCDDTDPRVHPGAVDVVDDGLDNDCDGVAATSPMDTGTSSTDRAADPSADDKGGCASAPRRAAPSLAWLALVGLLGLRRRSSTTRPAGSL